MECGKQTKRLKDQSLIGARGSALQKREEAVHVVPIVSCLGMGAMTVANVSLSGRTGKVVKGQSASDAAGDGCA